MLGYTPKKAPPSPAKTGASNAGVNYWARTLDGWLPLLSLVAPLTLFVSALARASGAGLLPGDLFWISTYEAPIAGVGAAFNPATFVFLGKVVAVAYPKAGVTVTIAGVLSTSFMVFIIAFRGLAATYVAKGVDPNLLADFMGPGLVPNMLYNVANFVAWVAAAVAALRGRLGPWWCGWSLLVGIFCIPVAQAAYYRIEIFYPLGTGLLTIGVWGLTGGKQRK